MEKTRYSEKYWQNMSAEKQNKILNEQNHFTRLVSYCETNGLAIEYACLYFHLDTKTAIAKLAQTVDTERKAAI